MAGNVMEWVNDWYQWDYYSISPHSNPTGPETGTNKVLRGGHFLTFWQIIRVAWRGYSYDPIDPAGGGRFIGFRCAASASGATYSISGHVRDASGNPIRDVTVLASAGHTATTGTDGRYALTDLPADQYVLRPTKPAYVFAPDAITIQLNADKAEVDFRGHAIACAVPVSEPFLQFPLAGYHTAKSFAEAQEDTDDDGLLNSWFDHDTPRYGSNQSVTLYTTDVYTRPVTSWVGSLPCMNGRCYDGHDGYDIVRPSAVVTHPTIYAAAEGTVVAACSSGSSTCRDMTCGLLGKQVWVDHENNYATLYAHLDTISVTVGTTVTTDTPLGTMGCTGNSDGTHLHFGVYFNSNLRDPWITSIDSVTSTEVVDPFGWDGWEMTPVISDTWDTPSVDLWVHAPRVTSYQDSSGGVLASPSGRVAVDIPTGALDDLTLMTLREAPVSAPSAILRSTGNGFRLQALWDWITGSSTLGAQAEGAGLAKPITVTISYADITLPHLETDRLTIHHWDEAGASWQPLSTTLDLEAQTALAQTDQLGAFDLQAPLICSDDVLEANDYYATASLLQPKDPVHTLFDIPDDEDWFRFEAAEGLTYTLATSGLGMEVDTVLELYDTDAATPISQDDNGGEGLASRLVWVAPASRSFYVRVRPAETSMTGCDAYYALTMSSAAPVLNHHIHLPLVVRSR